MGDIRLFQSESGFQKFEKLAGNKGIIRGISVRIKLQTLPVIGTAIAQLHRDQKIIKEKREHTGVQITADISRCLGLGDNLDIQLGADLFQFVIMLCAVATLIIVATRKK